MNDYILNGQAYGSVAARVVQPGFSPGMLRPWIGDDGRSYCAVKNKSGVMVAVPTQNANATLRKDAWKILDDAVVKAARPRLRAVADLRGRGLQFTIANGIRKTVLETETQSDITPATISMDGLRQGEADRPEFGLNFLPLPIIHKDFHYSARQLAVSQDGGSPLDTTTAELAARRVAEEAERLLLGVASSFAYGGGTIFGYTNFPSRLTRTISDPTVTGYVPRDTLLDVLAMRQQACDAHHFGPYVLYVAKAWDEFMDDDFSTLKGDNTLRERLERIENIEDVRTLDFLTNFDMVLVQMTTDVARMVVGMDITTVQWETMGGLQQNFKVMAILVPQLRADHNSNTGIVHGSV